jgi:hypothetical protein
MERTAFTPTDTGSATRTANVRIEKQAASVRNPTVPAGRSPLLDTHQAAAYLGVPRQTLALWRSVNGRGGPAFVKIGRHIKYKVEDLDAFIDSQRITPRA